MFITFSRGVFLYKVVKMYMPKVRIPNYLLYKKFSAKLFVSESFEQSPTSEV